MIRRQSQSKVCPIPSRALMTCFDQAAEAFGWQAQSNAGIEARRRLADRVGMRGFRVSDPDGGGDGPCPRLCGGPRAGRDSRTRDRQWPLYGRGADGGERLGIPVEKVSVSLGDTDLPPAPVAGGSISTASVCTVVAQACDAIRIRLGQDGKPAGDDAAAMKDRGMGALEEYAGPCRTASPRTAFRRCIKAPPCQWAARG